MTLFRVTVTRIRCSACAGSGRRHSMFDFCNCEPECKDGRGDCAWCNGSGLEPDRAESQGEDEG